MIRNQDLDLLLDLDLNMINAEIYKRDFYEFLKFAFRRKNGFDFDHNWHIEYLCKVLQEAVLSVINNTPRDYDTILINVPPRSLKTEIVSFALPLFTWINYTNVKFICSSYSASLTEDAARPTRDILDSEEWSDLFPDIRLEKGFRKVRHLGIKGRGERYSTSVKGTATGKPANIIIVDDLQSVGLAASELERTRALAFFRESLMTRFNNPSNRLTIVIMQRLHQYDLTGYLEAENRRLKHIVIPAEYVEEIIKVPDIEKYGIEPYPNKLFFPRRFTKESLETLRHNLGSQGYAAQYLQSPAPPDGNIFKKSWFKTISPINFNEKAAKMNKDYEDFNNRPYSYHNELYNQRLKQERPPQKLIWYFVLDTAFTEKTTNDPTGVMTYTYIDGKLYIKDFTELWCNFVDLQKEVINYVQEQGYTSDSMIYVENFATGAPLIEQIRRETTLNIIDFKFPSSFLDPNDNTRKESINFTRSKFVRGQSISLKVESGRIILIEGVWNKKYIDYMSLFPKAKHDEAVDLTVMACFQSGVMQDNDGRIVFA